LCLYGEIREKSKKEVMPHPKRGRVLGACHNLQGHATGSRRVCEEADSQDHGQRFGTSAPCHGA